MTAYVRKCIACSENYWNWLLKWGDQNIIVLLRLPKSPKIIYNKYFLVWENIWSRSQYLPMGRIINADKDRFIHQAGVVNHKKMAVNIINKQYKCLMVAVASLYNQVLSNKCAWFRFFQSDKMNHCIMKYLENSSKFLLNTSISHCLTH